MKDCKTSRSGDASPQNRAIFEKCDIFERRLSVLINLRAREIIDGASLALRFYAPPETNGTVAAALEEQHVCALAAHCLLNERSSFSKRIYLQRRRALGGKGHSSWW